MTQWHLIVVDADSRRRVVPVAEFPFRIGRSQDCAWRVLAPAVSRHHCELIRDNDNVYVRDLSSTNGTFLESQRVQGLQPLSAGDCISIGFARVYLENDSELDPTAAPTYRLGPCLARE